MTREHRQLLGQYYLICGPPRRLRRHGGVTGLASELKVPPETPKPNCAAGGRTDRHRTRRWSPSFRAIPPSLPSSESATRGGWLPAVEPPAIDGLGSKDSRDFTKSWSRWVTGRSALLKTVSWYKTRPDMSTSRDDYQDRIALKLAAITEVAPPDHPAPIAMSDALPIHQRLFEEYLRAARHAASRAQTRWQGLIEGKIESDGMNRKRAEREVRAESPAGPGEESEFIAELRRYWLKCVDANDDVPRDRRVPPEHFVLQWAANARASDVELIIRCRRFGSSTRTTAGNVLPVSPALRRFG